MSGGNVCVCVCSGNILWVAWYYTDITISTLFYNKSIFYIFNSWFSSDVTCAVLPTGTSTVSLSKLYEFYAANCTIFRYRGVVTISTSNSLSSSCSTILHTNTRARHAGHKMSLTLFLKFSSGLPLPAPEDIAFLTSRGAEDDLLPSSTETGAVVSFREALEGESWSSLGLGLGLDLRFCGLIGRKRGLRARGSELESSRVWVSTLSRRTHTSWQFPQEGRPADPRLRSRSHVSLRRTLLEPSPGTVQTSDIS